MPEHNPEQPKKNLPSSDGTGSHASKTAHATRRGKGPELPVSDGKAAVPVHHKTAIPQESSKSWRAKHEVREDGEKEEKKRPEDKRLARKGDEHERLLKAAGLAGEGGVAAIGTDGGYAFRCPACWEQVVCEKSDLGREMLCPQCAARLEIPAPGSPQKVRVISLASHRDGEDRAILPELRAEDGPSAEVNASETKYPTVDDSDELLEWGLEREENKDKNLRSRPWRWGLVVLVLLGLLVWKILPEKGQKRVSPEVPTLAQAALQEDEGIYARVEAVLTAYLSAGDIEEKARYVRGGATPERIERMRAHYARGAGYEPETKAFGEVEMMRHLGDRTVEDSQFRLIRVVFANGEGGVYALALPKTKEEEAQVDWDYAVGFGEKTFDELLAEHPENPVMIRCYVKEGRFFINGFKEKQYRQMDLIPHDPDKVLVAYVERGSAVEDAFRSAWFMESVDAAIRPTGSSDTLDFTLRVRYIESEVKNGFLIDEVLTRGWILPAKK